MMNADELTGQLYNSRLIDIFVQLIKTKYPHVDIRTILAKAGIEEYEVADQGHWFSEEQTNRFVELAIRATGNENLAREAGRYAATPGTLGVMRQYTLGLVGPANAFAIIERAARNFTRSAVYRSRKRGWNSVEVCVEPVAGVREESYVCENRKGYFEAIVTAFNLPIPRIEHPECIFEGDETCRYLIRWEPTLAGTLKRVRDIGIAVSAGVVGITAFTAPALLPTVGLSAVLLSLIIALAAEKSHSLELARSLNNLWNTSDQLNEQITLNYRNTQLSQDVGAIISSKNTIDEVIRSVIQVLKKRMDFDRGLVLLADSRQERLIIRGAFGYTEDQVHLLEKTAFSLNKPSSRGMFTRAFHDKKPSLVNDVDDVLKDLSPRTRDFIRRLEIRSFISCPIILEDEAIGVFAVDNRETKKPLMVSDMNMLMGVAPVIGVSIHNARLSEDQKAQFEATLRIMAASIDARDFLTAGHSEKVAEYVTGIARELELDEEFVSMVKIAALLHDYGKIGVPDAILKKAGRLTEEERAIIRTHPTRTREILEEVQFKGIYSQVPDIAASHHEGWDGSGYPAGLKGEMIPLGARIIAAADFFEAITSQRHYRDPMQMDQAVALLKEESGKQFEPRIVQALLRYLYQNRICILDQEPPSPPGSRGKENAQRCPYRTHVSAQMERKVIAGESVDISRQGMFVGSSEIDALQPAMPVVLTFALPHTQEYVKVTGNVAWLNGGDSRCKKNFPLGFGVEFTEIIPQAARKIERFLTLSDRRASKEVIHPLYH